jgi:hypothetical protein
MFKLTFLEFLTRRHKMCHEKAQNVPQHGKKCFIARPKKDFEDLNELKDTKQEQEQPKPSNH